MVYDEISVAIPYHGDREKYTIQTINHLSRLAMIKEIIVTLEPGSVFKYRHAKLKVFQNDKRLFVFRNKVNAVSRCSKPWVALLDSDNIFNVVYFNALRFQRPLNEKIVYCPEMGLPYLVYSKYLDRDIDSDTVGDMIGSSRFDMLFNTMNYFFHRETWLNALKEAIDSEYEPMSVDSMWINYHCLKMGMVMRVVKGMVYRHTVDHTSFYKEHIDFERQESPKIMQAMREWGAKPITREPIKNMNWRAT